jgi:hypothetical protein
MLSILALILAAPASAALPAAPPMPHEVPMRREFVGPTPGENHTLSMPHPNSDDRMFPDIAIGALQIDGDTLYVRLINRGSGPAQVPIVVAARAKIGGVATDLAQARTGKLMAGESRWVQVKGFSMKTAATNAPVFALENAGAVSAIARLVPSSAGVLDRSGQGCGECTAEMDLANNSVTLAGTAIKHGRPQ